MVFAYTNNPPIERSRSSARRSLHARAFASNFFLSSFFFHVPRGNICVWPSRGVHSLTRQTTINRTKQATAAYFHPAAPVPFRVFRERVAGANLSLFRLFFRGGLITAVARVIVSLRIITFPISPPREGRSPETCLRRPVESKTNDKGLTGIHSGESYWVTNSSC